MWGSSTPSPPTAKGSSDWPAGPSARTGPTTEQLFSLMASNSLKAGSGGGTTLSGRDESGLGGSEDEVAPFGPWFCDISAEEVASQGGLLPLGLAGVCEGGVLESW